MLFYVLCFVRNQIFMGDDMKTIWKWLVERFDKFLTAFLRMLCERVFFPTRVSTLTEVLSLGLVGCQRVLDLGCSDGRVARSLQSVTGGSYFGADVLLQQKISIPAVIYDGQSLPFRGSVFDFVTMIDMMHHSDGQEKLMAEAARVSGKFILVKDHFFNNWFDRTVLKVADFIGNKPYGINLPYNYLSMEAWDELFKKNDLKVIRSETFRFKWFDPTKQVIFLLKKS
jgi:SAM-dependent methyltransferase